MQKTVKVVDEVGNRYEATYVKRAQGLVKNGRARFIDDETICLSRPPSNLEDNNMTDIDKNEAVVVNKETEIPSETAATKYTLEYALELIELISKDNKHIYEALDVLKGLKSTGPGDVGTEEQSKAIANVVKCRETTNQQLIAFYEKIVEDLKPKNVIDENQKFLDWVRTCIEAEGVGERRPISAYIELYSAMRTMFS